MGGWVTRSPVIFLHTCELLPSHSHLVPHFHIHLPPLPPQKIIPYYPRPTGTFLPNSARSTFRGLSSRHHGGRSRSISAWNSRRSTFRLLVSPMYLLRHPLYLFPQFPLHHLYQAYLTSPGSEPHLLQPETIKNLHRNFIILTLF